MKRDVRLTVLVAVVGVSGLSVAVWAALRDIPVRGDAPWLSIGMLAAALIGSEGMPVRVTTGKRRTTLTFGAGFGYALVLVAPLGVALAVQIMAGLLDDLRQRKSPSRLIFNVGQWGLTYLASSAVFSAVAGTSTLMPHRLSWQELLAILAAGATYFVVNHGLVTAAVWLASGRPLRSLLVATNEGLALPYAMELALAPTSIALVQLSPWLVPLLVLPAAVMHRTGRLAALREDEALRDSLTGLPNRAALYVAFEDVEGQLTAEATELAVLLVDLDHFKEINDTLGHRVGDLLLSDVAARLASVLREGDIVARLGGDEFAVLAEVAPGEGVEEAQGLADRLRVILHEPFFASGVRIDVQGSVGISIAPAHGLDMDLLLSRADIALYKAKEERGSAVFYSEEQDRHTPERLSLLGELREGIDRGELVLHFQPKIDVATDVVSGVEALVRWQHPTKGLVPPYQFISLAENTGLIFPLTTVVMNSALQQARSWLDRGWPIGMSFNLSVRQLTDLDLPDQIAEAIERHGVPAQLVTVEVTESMIMRDAARSAVVIERIRNLGVSIAIDDYGTGYSSLAYLRELQVDELKIDRSFVSRFTGPGSDEVIIRSTVEMAHSLGLKVVAEGVEAVDTYRRLGEINCDLIQGYLVARPMPAAELEAWISDPQVSFHVPPVAAEPGLVRHTATGGAPA